MTAPRANPTTARLFREVAAELEKRLSVDIEELTPAEIEQQRTDALARARTRFADTPEIAECLCDLLTRAWAMVDAGQDDPCYQTWRHSPQYAIDQRAGGDIRAEMRERVDTILRRYRAHAPTPADVLAADDESNSEDAEP